MVRPGPGRAKAILEWLQRHRRAAATTIGVTVGVAAFLNIWLHTRTAPYRYHRLEQVPPHPTVIVLGASVYRSGRPSGMLRDRLDTALDLYHAGKARKILLSGDGREGYDEVVVMRRHALAHGATPADVFTDHAGVSTYASMVRARRLFQVDRAVIVTQGFHLARAVYIARAVGLDACGLAADRRYYRSNPYQQVREAFARVKGFIEVELDVSPRHLGPVTPIDGDGRGSWERAPRRGR